MKIIIHFLLFSILMVFSCPTTLGQAYNGIDRIYIHGTGYNTPADYQEFVKGVQAVDSSFIKTMPQNTLFQKNVLENNQTPFSANPVMFYWGDQNAQEITYLHQKIESGRLHTSRLTQKARAQVSNTLHDAVWLERITNKKHILNMLYQTVQASIAKHHRFILFGHSAGSLVTYNFILYRLAYLDKNALQQFISGMADQMKELQASDLQPTCLEALLNSNAMRIDANGRLVPFFKDVDLGDDAERIRIQYFHDRLQQLNHETQAYCIPPGALKGVITFGSPLSLFASSAANIQSDEHQLSVLMITSMMAHNMFWLNLINHNDPFAFYLAGGPVIQKLYEQSRQGMYPPGSLFTNYIIRKGGIRLLPAHDWYWDHPDDFTHAISDAYSKGIMMWHPQLQPNSPETKSAPENTRTPF